MDNLALQILRHTAKPVSFDDLWLVIDQLYRPTQDYYTKTVAAMLTIGMLHQGEGRVQRSNMMADLEHVYGMSTIDVSPESIAQLRAELVEKGAASRV